MAAAAAKLLCMVHECRVWSLARSSTLVPILQRLCRRRRRRRWTLSILMQHLRRRRV